MKEILQIKCIGNSMLPAIKPGASLSIAQGRFNEQQPQPGSIIAFKRGDGLVCHRFYGTVWLGFRKYGIEKGDHNRIVGLFRLDAYVGLLVAVDGTDGNTLHWKTKRPLLVTLLGGLLFERLDRFRRKFKIHLPD